MGHRCSFAIMEWGKVELFYGHWTALQIPDQLFWGPNFVEGFIREHEKVDWWLDDCEAEACVGLDKDKKIILVNDGASTLSGGPESDYFFELMSALWEDLGWRVRRVELMEEVALHMGYPVEAVRWIPQPEDPCSLDTITDSWAPEKSVYSVISTPEAHFAVSEFTLDLLANGPQLLDHLAHFPRLENVLRIRKSFNHNSIDSFIFIDASKKTLTIRTQGRFFVRHLPHIQAAWPGWEVNVVQAEGRE